MTSACTGSGDEEERPGRRATQSSGSSWGAARRGAWVGTPSCDPARVYAGRRSSAGYRWPGADRGSTDGGQSGPARASARRRGGGDRRRAGGALEGAATPDRDPGPRRAPRGRRRVSPTGRSAGQGSRCAGSASAATGSTPRPPSTAPRSERALGSGVNLIDTSTNYADGGSERAGRRRCVGDLVRTGRLAREATVVVSKIGYVQGQNLALAREREAAGRPFSEMVRYQDGLLALRPPGVPRGSARAGRSTVSASRPSTCACSTTRSTSSRMRRSAARARSRRSGTSSTGGSLAAFRFFEDQVAAGRPRLVRSVVEHGRAAGRRPRGDVPHADAGRRALRPAARTITSRSSSSP